MLLFRLIFVLSMLPQKYLAYSYYDNNDLNAPPFLCSEYEMLIVNTRKCVARCPIVCVRGVCFENDACPCAGQYMTSFTKGLVCAADCLPGCKEAGGFCAAPNLCVCRKGFMFDEVQRRCRKRHHLLDLCRGRCNFGKCNYNGECICAEGFELRSTLLGSICTPICKSDCGPHAYCHLPNMCACRNKHHHFGGDGQCHKDF